MGSNKRIHNIKIIVINSILFIFYSSTLFFIFYLIFVVSWWFILLIPLGLILFFKGVNTISEIISIITFLKNTNFKQDSKISVKDNYDLSVQLDKDTYSKKHNLKTNLTYIVINNYGLSYYYYKKNNFSEMQSTFLSLLRSSSQAKVSDNEYSDALVECFQGIIRLGDVTINTKLKPVNVGDLNYHVNLATQSLAWLLRDSTYPQFFFTETLMKKYIDIINNLLNETLLGKVYEIPYIESHEIIDEIIESVKFDTLNSRLIELINIKYLEIWESLDD